MRKSLFPAALLVACSLYAQPKKDASLEEASRKAAVRSLSEFRDLLRLPNDAHRPADIERNMQWCEKAFSRRGFGVSRLTGSGIPLLLAERMLRKEWPTVLIYLQIDGQPVDPSRWNQSSPWEPTLKKKESDGKWSPIPWESLEKGTIDPDWRIFARSTSDAKGPAMAYLAALDALSDMKTQAAFNMKVIMDFEEELGSPNLPDAVGKHGERLKADRLIIFDGPRHVSNQPTLSFGARGICEVTLVTYGPRLPVHSGNYGNYAPNPVFGMAHLLASMKGRDGRVLIDGFYDGVALTEQERRILAQVPDNEEQIRDFLGIAEPENVGGSFQEAMQYPTLNVRGMQALYIGEQARTLIPDKAVAELDIRLVPTSKPDLMIGMLRNHVEKQGYRVIRSEPSEEERRLFPRIASMNSKCSYGAFQTPFDSETGRWLSRAMGRAFGQEPIRIRMTGGSIPISPFVSTLGIPAVAVPTVNADNNQHAENENIRVGNYLDAVRTFLAILSEKF